jgi:hypothetical protein
MKDRIIQYIFCFALTLLLFCYASWGDFSWVTLTGPIVLEANVENMEGPSYIASPALQAIIVRFLFLIVCYFFCMIPNLIKELRKHAHHVLALLAAVYVLLSYTLGAWTFFATKLPGASTLRIASIISLVLLLAACYDTAHKNFRLGLLLQASFTGPLICLFSIICLANVMILQESSWLLNEQLHFVLLRIGVFTTALTGALAFHAYKRGA